MDFKFCLYFILLCSLFSCNTEKPSREVVLYNSYCASCHVAPDIQSLPKHIWQDYVLPEMGARMGIITPEKHPYYSLPFHEQIAVIKTGVYPSKPLIPLEDWDLLQKYIIELAPDSLNNDNAIAESTPLSQFETMPIELDSIEGSLITYLKINDDSKNIIMGTRNGQLNEFSLNTKTSKLLGDFNSAIIDARILNDSIYVTNMGKMDPNEIPRGQSVVRHGNATAVLQDSLHRPVHTVYSDLNNDGNEEIVISEFGDLKGKLTLLQKDDFGFYKESTLLNLPGALRVIPKDMNKDGRDDLVVMFSQGDEAVYILYQEDNLEFTAEKVIRFSPVYGSSWFELVDYNGDGFDDIITVNGDNADRSFVNKPYHGMRIHMNDGENNFEETYFHPLNGATRVIANDFDKDGDLDLALLATFPDYENHPEYNFVYLENINSEQYQFKQQHFNDIKMGRWFLMDAADIDADGDEDIVLSSLTFSFTPVPEYLEKAWKESKIDLLILENTLH